MYNSVVVIPIYKQYLTNYERISLTQCIRVLGNYPIYILKPDGLDLSFLSCFKYEWGVASFPDEFFRSPSTYNRLLLDKRFYEYFNAFDYILIYQTDAFVFKDELTYWCDKGFDYVGAPWIDVESFTRMPVTDLDRLLYKYALTRRFIKPKRVGNGGFSLRNISSSLCVLNKIPEIVDSFTSNEDVFWSIVAPKLTKFNIPEYEVALNFSLELKPKVGYELNGNTLPFGCHAWERWDIEFWRPIFLEYGYEI